MLILQWRLHGGLEGPPPVSTAPSQTQHGPSRPALSSSQALGIFWRIPLQSAQEVGQLETLLRALVASPTEHA